jgi:hypothetical protein
MPNWVGPTPAEIEAWADRERHRRQQWALGPTPEQAAVWAILERERRTFERRQARPPSRTPIRLIRHALRELQFAGVGALRLLVNTSAGDVVDYLVQAGLDWEQELRSSSER